MPPKPQVFKTPDGKEFNTRAEWRDYMMLTFYTFKDKKDEPQPLVKNPGDIDGQQFDIGDCENCTLVIMDHCEQVQIDMLKNCRVFVGACASSIFIRNCENCVFYTSCRQLRLREVVNTTFYIYSTSEVHIEYSNAVRFAPFNGGYPDHAKHLQAANLPVDHNLWYDIFDHNDPAKECKNWSLVPEGEYEEPWFPAGTPCEPAVPRTKPGSVVRTDLTEGGAVTPGGENMQSFSAAALRENVPPPAAAAAGSPAKSVPPPVPSPTKTVPPVATTPAATAPAAMIKITEGVEFNVIAREWRMKWSADNDKKSLQSVQLALDTLLPQIKSFDGVKSVERIVCGGCLDFKVIVSLPADKWGAWENAKFAPEEQFLTAVKAVEGITLVETQTYTKMTM